jgi:hypothetical protein
MQAIDGDGYLLLELAASGTFHLLFTFEQKRCSETYGVWERVKLRT